MGRTWTETCRHQWDAPHSAQHICGQDDQHDGPHQCACGATLEVN